jgi:cytochrome c oxidase subunit 4
VIAMTERQQTGDVLADTVYDEPGGGEHRPHIVPLWQLASVFAALIALTIATVAVTYVDLGSLNLWVAMIIAGVKGALVAAIFMHLGYDRGAYAFIFFSAIAFVALFIAIALMDTQTYLPDLIRGYAPAIKQP